MGLVFPSLEGQGMISIDVETRDPDLKTKGPGYHRDGYIAGIAVGLYQQAGPDDAGTFLVLGAVAVLGNVLSFALVTRAQKIKSASRWRTSVHAAWSEFMLKNVASRDFSVVVLIAAVLGKLDWFLWMASAGSLVFAILMLWVIRPSATSRA